MVIGNFSQDLHLLGRLAVAMLLTGALGWERSRSGKSAGIRTHMIVGLGACFFMMLPEMIIEHYRPLSDKLQFDPERVIQAVVAGISFVGAGTIFVSKGKDHVKGLTTAASIWTCTAIGMCVGLGKYLLPLLATLLLLVVLEVVAKIEPEANEARSFEGEVGSQPNSGGAESGDDESMGQTAKRRSNPGAS